MKTLESILANNILSRRLGLRCAEAILAIVIFSLIAGGPSDAHGVECYFGLDDATDMTGGPWCRLGVTIGVLALIFDLIFIARLFFPDGKFSQVVVLMELVVSGIWAVVWFVCATSLSSDMRLTCSVVPCAKDRSLYDGMQTVIVFSWFCVPLWGLSFWFVFLNWVSPPESDPYDYEAYDPLSQVPLEDRSTRQSSRITRVPALYDHYQPSDPHDFAHALPSMGPSGGSNNRGSSASMMATSSRTDLSASSASSSSLAESSELKASRAIALYSHTPDEKGRENEAMLAFRRNDILEVIEYGVDWTKARINGVEGWVPTNHIRPL